MDLKEYLRIKFNMKIRPLFIKVECEMCKSKENLHLHHIKYFNEIVSETLSDLKLQIKETEEYGEIDLNNIINVFLGKHLQIKYITVCQQCHIDIHKKDSQQKEIERNNYIHNEIIPYLIDNKNRIMLTHQDRKDLIDKLNIRSNGKIIHNVNTINENLKIWGTGFYIKKFETSRMVNGKKEKFKAVWKIEGVLK